MNPVCSLTAQLICSFRRTQFSRTPSSPLRGTGPVDETTRDKPRPKRHRGLDLPLGSSRASCILLSLHSLSVFFAVLIMMSTSYGCYETFYMNGNCGSLSSRYNKCPVEAVYFYFILLLQIIIYYSLPLNQEVKTAERAPFTANPHQSGPFSNPEDISVERSQALATSSFPLLCLL